MPFGKKKKQEEAVEEAPVAAEESQEAPTEETEEAPVPDAAEETLPVPEPLPSDEGKPFVLVSREERGTLEPGDLYNGRKIVRIDEMAGSYQLTLE